MAPNEKSEAYGVLPEAAVKALGLKPSEFVAMTKSILVMLLTRVCRGSVQFTWDESAGRRPLFLCSYKKMDCVARAASSTNRVVFDCGDDDNAVKRPRKRFCSWQKLVSVFGIKFD